MAFHAATTDASAVADSSIAISSSSKEQVVYRRIGKRRHLSNHGFQLRDLGFRILGETQAN
jgi:hypothetical protein